MKTPNWLKVRDIAISNTLNIGGTLLILAGLILMPVHMSIRLIAIGCFFLLMWYAYDR